MTDLTEQQITSLAKLREPFPAAEIRYLPRVWCGNCRDMKGACKIHQRAKCQKCRNNISSAHIDLAYVGHAEATNRLLNIDPAWGWEPVALDEKGLPQHDQNGGLWIRLTVCGVTRLGYGNAEGKRGGDAVKEIIGDAIRNAGMRFGMALDLWTSSDLEIAENGPKDAPVGAEPKPGSEQGPERQSTPAPAGAKRSRPKPAADPDAAATDSRPGAMPPAGEAEQQAALDAMWAAARDTNFVEGLPAQFASAFGHPIEQGTASEFRQATSLMRTPAAA
ncbi:hypothetical protein [Streptomyces adelaidensis]|uniref:hypothetical protein n=1 Tax=Streptomyces adelaidensis TaxID=2796465 RepID=UPI00190849B0|nr:hypothetical protein [Streptomyces adelaidensis]